MRNLIALFCVLFTYACGFTPVYLADKQIPSQINQIDIAVIKNREGVYLRNALMDRFYRSGTPSTPRYHLIVDDIQETIKNFDITIDSEATLRQLRLQTSYRLVDSQNGQVLLSRSLTAATSHNVLESEFTTLVTEQSAREVSLDDLARQIEQHISLYFLQ